MGQNSTTPPAAPARTTVELDIPKTAAERVARTEKPSCLTCDLWDKPRIEQGAPIPSALCRAKPPEIGQGGLAHWPATRPQDWCGSHPLLRGA